MTWSSNYKYIRNTFELSFQSMIRAAHSSFFSFSSQWCLSHLTYINLIIPYRKQFYLSFWAIVVDVSSFVDVVCTTTAKAVSRRESNGESKNSHKRKTEISTKMNDNWLTLYLNTVTEEIFWSLIRLKRYFSLLLSLPIINVCTDKLFCDFSFFGGNELLTKN